MSETKERDVDKAEEILTRRDATGNRLYDPDDPDTLELEPLDAVDAPYLLSSDGSFGPHGVKVHCRAILLLLITPGVP